MSTISVEISSKPINLESFGPHNDNSTGAEVIFIGRVRDFNHGKKVSAVSYDIHEALAHTVIADICRLAQAEWQCSSVHVVARHGKLSVGEASIAIAVCTPHRNEAYQICRYVIEEIKVKAPIWKKEHYEDGETEWLKGHALCSHA